MWGKVDFFAKNLTVGKSKTAAGTGRIIPLNPRAVAVLTHWRSLFRGAAPEHYVFPHERYGLAGNDRKQCAYEIIPTEPMHRWKVAWESARKTANVACRFHDLRHTFISRLAESQTSDSTVRVHAAPVIVGANCRQTRMPSVRSEQRKTARASAIAHIDRLYEGPSSARLKWAWCSRTRCHREPIEIS